MLGGGYMKKDQFVLPMKIRKKTQKLEKYIGRFRKFEITIRDHP